MEELIALLFLSREITHREHLITDSFAQHMALGSFYGDVVDLADSLAEAYQGRSEKRLASIPYYSNPMEGKPPVQILKKILAQIQEVRKDCCPSEDSTIQNIIDEVEALFLSTIYKLTFLK